MLQSFVGHSYAGMDDAAKDAHKDLATFFNEHGEQKIIYFSTACQVTGDDDSDSYWFILTILFAVKGKETEV